MPRAAQGGFTLVETLMAAVVLGAGLASVTRVLGAAARGEGEVRGRMQARLEALDALEAGDAPAQGSFRVARAGDGGRIRLRVWVGP